MIQPANRTAARDDPETSISRSSEVIAPPSRWSAEAWLFASLLIAGVLLAYHPAWHAGFIWDDDDYVTNNPLLPAADGLRRIWFSFDSPSQYFPLAYTMLRFEYNLWGLAPFGYHLVNIVLHGVNAVLLWRLLLRLEIRGAWIAASIFALHPVQVESVAWVTELKNLLMSFFLILSLHAWVRFDSAENIRKWRYYALSILFYALALFSKTTACTLPAVILLIDWLRGQKIGKRRLVELIPFVLIGIGMGILTMFWERYHQGTEGKSFDISLPDRLLIAARSVWFYLDKLLWPAKLTFSYPRWTLSAHNPLDYIWLLALIAAAGTLFYFRRRPVRGVCVAVAFFVITLGPVLGFLMLYTFRYSFVADHYQYVACIGPIALVSAGLENWRQRAPFAALPFIVITLALLARLTWMQTGMYYDINTLWRATIARNPSSWMAHDNLGNDLVHHGNMKDAIDEFKTALSLNPLDPESNNNLGNALLQQGNLDQSIPLFREAILQNPKYAQAYNNLGAALLSQGHSDEAMAQFNAALQLDPTYARAHYNLANASFFKGASREAISEYTKALQFDPNLAQAQNNLASALLREGRRDEAMTHLVQALKIDPNFAEAHYNLANALFQSAQFNEAIAEYGQTLRIDPNFSQAHGNLGIALVHIGKIGDAIPEFQRALQLDPSLSEVRGNLAHAYLKQGRTQDAIAEAGKALSQKPDSIPLENNLAWILATAPKLSDRDGPRALHLAISANEATGGNNSGILHTLAASYAANGQYDNAIQAAQKALQIAESRSDSNLAAELNRELELYQAGQPYHE